MLYLKVLDKSIKVHDLILLVDMRILWETKLLLGKYLLCMKCVSADFDLPCSGNTCG